MLLCSGCVFVFDCKGSANKVMYIKCIFVVGR